jgi:hypothetical protein
MRRARPATHGVGVPARMRFTAAELTEIRHAFRQRLATERVLKKPARRKRRPKPPRYLVREPDYDDTYILTPALVAELFAVTSRTVRRWADAGTLPSFRTVGGKSLPVGRDPVRGRLTVCAPTPERAIGLSFSLHRCVTFREQRVTSRRGAYAPLLVCWTCFCTRGMSALTRYFPGFGLWLCPGGTPGPELEHTPPSWSVHFVPLGAVHASALGAVAPTNTAAPRTTPKRRFFMRCPPLLRGHLPISTRPTTRVPGRRRTKRHAR